MTNIMTPQQKKKILILIPCRNEQEGIGDTIDGLPREKLAHAGFSMQVMVIDNASTDRTAHVARSHGATVLHEKRPGKGNAMRLGFASVPLDTDYVVMIDGDNTYQSAEILRMVELLDSEFSEVVIGSRLTGKITAGSMSFFNRFGNWIFSNLVRNLYRANVTDVLSGYYAWTRDALERLRPHLVSEGFGIEMEMVTKMARMKEEIYCVPITYIARSGDSNLHPVYDGFRILRVFLQNIVWKPRKMHIEQKPVGRQRHGFAAPSDV